MNVVEQYINSFGILSSDIVKAVMDRCEYIQVKKNTILCQQGAVMQYLYFIEKGVVRSFTFDNKGKEITSFFYFDKMPVTLSDSFFTQTASHQGLDVIEEATMYRIYINDYNNLFQKHSALEKVRSETLLRFLIHANKRIMDLQYLSARERFDNLMANNPHIFNRAPLGMIASYLGITQETLSRLRSSRIQA